VSPKSIPPFRRRKLGRRIRELRETARMTLEVAAKQLDMTRFTLARLEKGENRMDVHVARSMMDLYDAYDDGLIEEVRRAQKPGWWREHGIQDRGYFGMEDEADQVYEFCLINVPGLLQTRGYAEALFAGSGRMSDSRISDAVNARLFRQRRLVAEEDPLLITAVIDESVLRRQVGGASVMARQLRQLAIAASWPTVTLQVVPFSAGAHASMDGAFSILTFAEEPPGAYVSFQTGAMHIERSDQVDSAMAAFDRVRAVALAPDESIRLVARIADGYERA